MSYVSQLKNGRISLQEFCQKSADEIRKDLAFLNLIPGSLDWALQGLGGVLASQAGLSPTIVTIIIATIKGIVSPPVQTSPPVTPPTPPSPPVHQGGS